jgi:OOP family OmpA-OmpF porin
MWRSEISKLRVRGARQTVCAAAMFASLPAFAAGGFYIGGGLGLSYGSFDGDDFSTGSVQQAANEALVDLGLPSGVVITSSDTSKEGFGWKLFAGYRFNEYLGIEGSYANFGTFNADYNGTYLGVPLAVGSDYKVDSWNLMGVLRYLIDDALSFQAKLGAAFTNATNEVSLAAAGTAASVEESENKTNFLWGLGAGYNFTPKLAVLAEYENYGKVGSADTTGRVTVSLWSISLLYGF